MEAIYWRSLSRRFARRSRALQTFAEVALLAGTPELREAVDAALPALRRIVAEMERLATEEAGKEAADQPDWSVGGETTEESPLRYQYEAHEDYCHERQVALGKRRLSWAGLDPVRASQHTDHSGSRLFVASPLDSLFD